MGKVKYFIEKITGFYIIKKRHLPIGIDLFIDLKYKLNFNPENIFDVGANIGQTAIEFNKSFPKANIFSFEPVSKTYEELKNNTKNKINIFCYKIALGEKKDNIETFIFPNTESVLNSLVPELMNNKGGIKEIINVKTLDSFLDENKQIKEIDLLKIDTEGYDLNVIKGATNAFKENKIKMIIIEVGFYKDDSRHIGLERAVEEISQLGFTFFGIYDLRLKAFLGKYYYGNVLFVSDNFLNN
jgi:FkbM family methyltransferase